MIDPANDTDYYRILGVIRTASPAEIDAAYRALARRHHPDLGGATPESIARLKLINEAYGTLSDVQRRREYDREHPGATRIRVSHGAPHKPSSPVRRQQSEAPRHAGREPHELSITPEEARNGGLCELTLTTWQGCPRCGGKGAGVPCPECHGRGSVSLRQTLCVELPPGLRTGSVLQLRGGLDLLKDVLLVIRVRPCW
jgi:DnaJ-class molecular chaperone